MSPLDGVKIVEFGSIGPGPFAAMVLADLGATVIRLRRAGEKSPVEIAGSGADHRGRPGLVVDLKNPEDVELALCLVAGADALIEGFRPGVMERLGLGPDVVQARNPRVVYGRMTGYGQTGPLARTPGHDINYAAISGVLSTIGRHNERPVAPINLLADYGGGGMLLAMGILAALFEARHSGVGHVVDAAMVDGVAQLATIVFSFANAGAWGPRGTNVLDSGAPFYDVYETADGKYFAVGAIEPQFYAALLDGLGIPAHEMPQWDREDWPAHKGRLAAIFKTRTREQWTTQFQDTDACATPVLDLTEAPHHPHNAARSNFVLRDHGLLPASAPRFGTDAPQVRQTPTLEDALSAFGLGSEAAAALAARAG
jgi:alpha-methylacyl-CoA racemase